MCKMLYTSIRRRGLEEFLGRSCRRMRLSPHPTPEESQWSDILMLPQAKGRRPQGEHLENLTSVLGIREMYGLVCNSCLCMIKAKAVARAAWNGKKTQPAWDLVVFPPWWGQVCAFQNGTLCWGASLRSWTKSFSQEDHMGRQGNLQRKSVTWIAGNPVVGSRKGQLWAASWSRRTEVWPSYSDQ